MDNKLEISTQLISSYVENELNFDITDDAVAYLQKKITSQLYDLLQECKEEMNVYRMTKLTPKIISNVFENNGIPKQYGSSILRPFVKISQNLTVLKNSEIDLISYALNQEHKVDLKISPILVGEYVQPANFITMKKETKHQDNQNYILSKVCSEFFVSAAQIITCNSDILFHMVMRNHIRSNPRLGYVAAGILNMVVTLLQSRPPEERLLSRLLHTVTAIMQNKFVNPSATITVDVLVKILFNLMINASITELDDYAIKYQIAKTIHNMCELWQVDVITRRYMLIETEALLQTPDANSWRQTYAAMMMLRGLGVEGSRLWLLLRRYLITVDSLEKITTCKRKRRVTNDFFSSKTVLLYLVDMFYRSYWTDDPELMSVHKETDQLLCSYLGDSLMTLRWCASPKLTQSLNDKPNTRSNVTARSAFDFSTLRVMRAPLAARRRKRSRVEEVFEECTLKDELFIFRCTGLRQQRRRRKQMDGRFKRYVGGVCAFRRVCAKYKDPYCPINVTRTKPWGVELDALF